MTVSFVHTNSEKVSQKEKERRRERERERVKERKRDTEREREGEDTEALSVYSSKKFSVSKLNKHFLLLANFFSADGCRQIASHRVSLASLVSQLGPVTSKSGQVNELVDNPSLYLYCKWLMNSNLHCLVACF